MLAVRWHARGDVRVEEVPPPAPPGPGELQLQVRWCGICGTDLEEWLSGPVFIPAAVPHPLTGARAPLILGHEFAGVVIAVGAGVTGPLPGQRVAVDTIVSCGSCHWCQRGEVTRCPALGALGLHGDGGLAELCNAPARMCLPVPDTVADDEAALAEPLAVAVRALRRGGLRPGERVAVVGAGTVGLMAVQAAAMPRLWRPMSPSSAREPRTPSRPRCRRCAPAGGQFCSASSPNRRRSRPWISSAAKSP
jgi:(R,R)-butanediol dehydrogenase/meso-butanediol dehydrogenase/diacetyl reductase